MSKYDIDSISRDLAFEIVLGGDRFDRDDLMSVLPRMTAPELAVFRERTLYHSLDFCPPSVRDDSFVRRCLDWWLGDVKPLPGGDVRPEIAGPLSREDRGKWFRFPDGSLRQCGTATVGSFWYKDPDLSSIDLAPVPLERVAKEKVSALIDRHGVREMRDSLYDTVRLSSGSGLVLSRQVDDLADPLDRVFTVTYPVGDDGVRTVSLRDLPEDALNGVIFAVMEETDIREGREPVRSERNFLDITDDVRVGVPGPDGSVREISLQGVSVDRETGRVVVTGTETGTGGRVLWCPVADLSDRDVDKVSAAARKDLALLMRHDMGIVPNTVTRALRDALAVKGKGLGL